MADDKTPKLYKGRRNIAVSIEHLFKTVKSISTSGTEADFLKACRDQRLTITASPKVVNAVKTHIVEAGLHDNDEHAAQVATSPQPPPGQPPTCFPVPTPRR